MYVAVHAEKLKIRKLLLRDGFSNVSDFTNPREVVEVT